MNTTIKWLIEGNKYASKHCRSINVTGAYGAQKTELNISLTAIGLLWTTTDFIVKGLLRGSAVEKETGKMALYVHSINSYKCIFL